MSTQELAVTLLQLYKRLDWARKYSQSLPSSRILAHIIATATTNNIEGSSALPGDATTLDDGIFGRDVRGTCARRRTENKSTGTIPGLKHMHVRKQWNTAWGKLYRQKTT